VNAAPTGKTRARCALLLVTVSTALAACLVPAAPAKPPDPEGPIAAPAGSASIAEPSTTSAPSTRPSDAQGGLSADQIKVVVMANLTPLRNCYESEASHNPELKGYVSAKWTIGKNGRVTDATILSSTMNDGKVDACIVKVIKRWDFPPSPAPSTVEWPFKFGIQTEPSRR
jgi:TonB family protein